MVAIIITIQILGFIVQNALVQFRIITVTKQALTLIIKRDKIGIRVLTETNLTVKLGFNRWIKIIVDHIEVFLIIAIQFKIIEERFISRWSI